MARVSVTVSQKPKPKHTFKYLRRDEGRLSYTYNPGDVSSPMNQPSTPSAAAVSPKVSERKSLKDAIANDMKNRKAADPFGDLVVAMPKKGPPSNIVSETSSAAPRSNSAPPAAKRKPVQKPPPPKREWISVCDPVNEDVATGPMREEEASQPVQDTRTNYPSRQPFGEPRDDNQPPRRSASSSRTQPSAGQRDREEQRTYGNPPIPRPASAPRRMEYGTDYSSISDPGYDSYIQPQQRPMRNSLVGNPRGRGEDDIITQQLERELEAARFEREHFMEARRNLDAERQRFDNFRQNSQQDLEFAQSRMEAERRAIMREAQKDTRSLEERHRTVTALLEQEKSTNNRLSQENDLLNSQLNELTTTMKENQRVQKAEIARLRRDVESLTHRNRELLAMTRQSQIETLEAAASASSSSKVLVPPLELQTVASYSYAQKQDDLPASRNARMSGRDQSKQRRGTSEHRRYDDFHQDGRQSSVEKTASPSNQRSGHPLNTPRSIHSAQKTAQRTMTTSSTKIPTKEQLIGTTDAFPPTSSPGDSIVSKNALGDNPNKREVMYRSGKREIHYANGTTKILLPSGHTELKFVNGDVKQTFPNGKSTYWYDNAKTMHTQLSDGAQLFEFYATGQTEKHLPGGEKRILYPDGIYKIVHPDGTDETLFPDK